MAEDEKRTPITAETVPKPPWRHLGAGERQRAVRVLRFGAVLLFSPMVSARSR